MSLKSLNSTQKSAVEAVDGPVLIFAGAGSGKTRVLTHKLFYLVDEGIFDPEEILAVTFTNKAAKEMKDRVMELLKRSELPLSIGTFHSICARILREDIQVLGFSKHFAIYDVKDQIDLLKVLFEDNDISKTIITPNQLRNQISLLKNKIISPDSVERKARTILEKTISKIYAQYQKALKLNDALDFDDLLNFPLEIFKKKPSILNKYQKRWKYILVDEYQDTNRAQFQFLTKLALAKINTGPSTASTADF
jgi:DNA helicase-2/ATP-dependent DNA helicase PcrA